MFKIIMARYCFNLCLILLITACSTGCSIQSKFTAENVIIEMEKTGCRGTCPSYLLKINQSGLVLYEGREHVEHTGTYRARLTEDQLDQLIQQFQAIEFFSLEDVYHEPVSDLPTTYISFRHEGRVKRIMDYYDAPEKLRRLEEMIEQTVHGLDFRKVN